MNNSLNNSIKYNLTLFFIVCLMFANSINWILQIPNGLAIIVFISFVFVTFLNIKYIAKNVNLKIVFFILYIYLFFLFSLINSNNTKTLEYFIQFSFLGVLPLLLSSIPTEHKKIYPIITAIGLIFTPFVFRFNYQDLFLIHGGDTGGIIMGLSYGLLGFAIAGIIILFLYKPKNNFNKLIIYVVVTAILFFLLRFGSRGPLLSILLLILLLYVYKKDNHFRLKSLSFFTSIVLLFIITGIIFFNWIYPNLIENNIEFRFYEKMILLVEEGDISHGRMDISFDTLKMIIERPLFGYGIGTYSSYLVNYPHNLFLHFLFEGGILLCIPFIFVFVKSIYIMFSDKFDYNFRVYVIFLFFSSVIQLLFSSQPWISQMFWLYVGTIIISSKFKITNINTH